MRVRTPSEQSGYALVAEALGHPVFDIETQAPPAFSGDQLLEQMRARLILLEASPKHERDVAILASTAHEAIRSQFAVHERNLGHDVGGALLMSTVSGAMSGGKPGAALGLIEGMTSELGASMDGEVRRTSGKKREEAARLELPALAEKYAGARRRQRGVRLDYTEAQLARLPVDVLDATNRSGRTLTNVTVQVALNSENGKRMSSVHFARRWPRGEAIRLFFTASGDPRGVGLLPPAPVQTVDLVLWSDQVSGLAERYEYGAAERLADAAVHCRRSLNLRVGYDPPWFLRPQPLLILHHEGVDKLPSRKLTVTVETLEGERSHSVDLAPWLQENSWLTGEALPLKCLLPADFPASATALRVEMRLAEYDFVYRQEFDLTAGN